MEATIWQVGSGEGIKKVLAEISLGKEVTVSCLPVIQKTTLSRWQIINMTLEISRPLFRFMWRLLTPAVCGLQEILSACWAYDLRDRPTFTQLADMLEKLPKLNRRLSHPGHFWKSAE